MTVSSRIDRRTRHQNDRAAQALTTPRVFLELILVIGLPLMSVAIGSTLAFYAYTQGFTSLPAATAAAASNH